MSKQVDKAARDKLEYAHMQRVIAGCSVKDCPFCAELQKTLDKVGA